MPWFVQLWTTDFTHSNFSHDMPPVFRWGWWTSTKLSLAHPKITADLDGHGRYTIG